MTNTALFKDNHNSRKRNPYIDIVKFIMALLVVAIHVSPADGELGFVIVNVIARVADPMFFIITAYFFFAKVRKAEEKNVLRNYIKRIAILYAEALIIYSPQIISNCLQACDNSLDAVLWLAKKVLFQGPYGTLWFLTALLQAIIFTFVSVKYLGPWKTVAVSFVLYLPSILDTEYSALFSSYAPMRYFTKIIIKVFGWYANGLTFGFFFCAIGMMFAFEFKSRDFKKDLFMLIISFAALFAESHIVRQYELGKDYWALFFLTPVCIYGMRVLLELPKSAVDPKFVTKTKTLQEMSVLVFIFHYVFLDGFNSLLGSSSKWGYYYPILRYSLVAIVTVLFSMLIIRLSNFDRLKFLRYLY